MYANKFFHSRNTAEQVKMLRRQENRKLFKKVEQDTQTLKSNSIRGALDENQSMFTTGQESVNRYKRLSVDSTLQISGPYRRVGKVAQNRQNEVQFERHPSASTNTTSRSNNSHVSHSTDITVPDQLSPIRSASTQRKNLLRIPSFNYPQDGEQSASPEEDATSPIPRGKGSQSKRQSMSGDQSLSSESKRSALRSVASSLKILPPPRLPTSRGSISNRHRRLSSVEPNISIDLSTPDGVNAPPIVKASQAGAASQVEILITQQHADIEVRHTSTGRNALAVCAHCGKDEVVEVLLRHGANVNTKDVDLATPLHLAASRGYTGVLSLLLTSDVEIDARDANGRTALWRAVEAGHLETSKLLLRNFCKVNSRAADQMTPLHMATEHGDEDMVSLLLRYGSDVEAKDVLMKGALHYACQNGHQNTAALLLKHKADIEAAGTDRMTPLIFAAARGHLSTAEFLLKRNASIRNVDENCMNALHWAACNGHAEVVDLLLRKNISIRSVTRLGQTPLHLAIKNKNFDVVDLLLRRQAPPDLRCHEGLTPLHLACLADDVDLVRPLLAAGADIEAADEEKHRRPIHIAAALGSVNLTIFLCEKGACLSSMDKSDDRPLCIACKYGHYQVVELLLDAGAKMNEILPGHFPDSENPPSDSPLCIASEKGHVAVVELLLKRGASPHETDRLNRDPLIYAAHYGHPTVLEILLQYSSLSHLVRFLDLFKDIGFAQLSPISADNKTAIEKLIFRKKVQTDTRFFGGARDYRSTSNSLTPRVDPAGKPTVQELPSTIEQGLPNSPVLSRIRQWSSESSQIRRATQKTNSTEWQGLSEDFVTGHDAENCMSSTIRNPPVIAPVSIVQSTSGGPTSRQLSENPREGIASRPLSRVPSPLSDNADSTIEHEISRVYGRPTLLPNRDVVTREFNGATESIHNSPNTMITLNSNGCVSELSLSTQDHQIRPSSSDQSSHEIRTGTSKEADDDDNEDDVISDTESVTSVYTALEEAIGEREQEEEAEEQKQQQQQIGVKRQEYVENGVNHIHELEA